MRLLLVALFLTLCLFALSPLLGLTGLCGTLGLAIYIGIKDGYVEAVKRRIRKFLFTKKWEPLAAKDVDGDVLEATTAIGDVSDFTAALGEVVTYLNNCACEFTSCYSKI